jgi:hypothetical protein
MIGWMHGSSANYFAQNSSRRYHRDSVRTLWEPTRSYLTLTKDLTRVINRVKALYRSCAIPCPLVEKCVSAERSISSGDLRRLGAC